MATTSTSICNSALLKVGAEIISSLNEDNKRARICKEQYEKIRDDVLRSHPWNFAIKRATLAQLITAPEYEYDYQYLLPSDCLRVIDVSPKTTKYVIEGANILTHSNSLKIRYIAKVTDPTNYDPNFVEALALRMASELAYPVVQSISLKQELLKEYEEFIGVARTADGQEGTPEDMFADTFLDARYLGVTYGIDR